MSTDYAEKEREFIAGLEADTGRDLAGWMAAITAQGLAERNDIIDWLRRQRFTFSKASWLERIHHNGGRPVYAEKPDLKALAAEAFDAPARAVRAPAAAARPPPAASSPARPAAPPAAPPEPAAARVTTAAATPDDLDTVLARGKAFRMLAQHLIRVLTTALPGLVVGTRAGLVTFSAAGSVAGSGAARSATAVEFAVLAVSAKDLRLGLGFGAGPVPDGFTTTRIAGAGPIITHMLVLTDARQVGDVLAAHVAAARDRTIDLP